MSKDIQELLDLLKSEAGIDELPDDLADKVEDMWPDEPDEDDLFTQEDVDEIVQQRLARERKAHEQEIDELESKLEETADPSEYKELQKELDQGRENAQERVAEIAKEERLRSAGAMAGVRKD